MKTLRDYVGDFTERERPECRLLGEDAILAQMIAATRFVFGYTHGREEEDIDEATELSLSDYAIIRRLFLLYVEREAALQQEASRGLGVDVFGRSSSEASADITQLESEIPRMAFFVPMVTV